jgi:cyclophilin family peptidyl-prolyl cis-trans isomerase
MAFLTQRIQLVTYEDLGNMEEFLVDGELPDHLIAIDGSNAPSSPSFTMTTGLQTLDVGSHLPPLRSFSDFTPRTAQEVTIVTNRGTIVMSLYSQEAPHTVTNFLTLIDEGFYDGLRFHRIDPGFVVQVGDPASRDVEDEGELLTLGSGGPGYRIADEISPVLSHYAAGTVAMANLNLDGSLPDTAGSQFYITLAPATFLAGRYAIFARVISGMEVVEQLQLGDVIESITYQ